MTSPVDPCPATAELWPPRVHLSPSQRRHVLDNLRERAARCPSCGGSRFQIGDPELAEAFHDQADCYRMAVKCVARGCPGISWSLTLRARQFLYVAHP